MTALSRILIVTPHPWNIPHEVNDHIAQFCDALVKARKAGKNVPEPVVAAPMSSPHARRTTRKALRALSSGAEASSILSLAGSTSLYAAKGGVKRPTEASHEWPLIALAPSLGPASVGQRAALRVLMNFGEFDLIHIHDLLDAGFTRFLAKHWHGLTVASLHTEPTNVRERVTDPIDDWFVPDTAAAEKLRLLLDAPIEPKIAKLDTSADSLLETYLSAYASLSERIHVNIPTPAKPDDRSCIIDLHMHTSHSWDCATEPEALLQRAQAVGLTAIAVTDHNEVSGALACAELADPYNIQVIVGEEVKTAQGEVIGLFLKERIEPGLSWHETLAQIRAQDGLVYVPHPFDRLHTIPDIHLLRETLDEIDAFETYNARLPLDQYNRDAEQFARKYNLVEGAGSDAHVVQGLGTAAVHMPAWDDPESFIVALAQGEILRRPKSLLYLQGLKWVNDLTGKSKKIPAEAYGQ